MPFLFILMIVLLVTIVVLVLFYVWKTAQFRKQTYGKKTVGAMLRRFARPRQYQVFSDVTFEHNGKSAAVDHVLVGDFGLLFVSSIQGSGSFYGDYKDERWFFEGENQKVYFKNPVSEMERKIELFRAVLAQNKIYSVPVESAVVIVSLAKETKLYLNNAGKEQPVVTSQAFPAFLRSPRFEVQRAMDTQAVKELLAAISK